VHSQHDPEPAHADSLPPSGSPVLHDVLDLVARGGFAAVTTAMLAMVAVQVRTFVPWTVPGLVLIVVPILAWVAFGTAVRGLCARPACRRRDR